MGRGLKAKVPFADGHRLVAPGLEELRQQDFGERQAADGIGAGVARLAGADRMAARQQAGAGGAADGSGGVEGGEASALGRQTVEMRRPQRGMPVAGKIAVAHVVGEQDDEVWQARGELGKGGGQKLAPSG
jgi:hypothetical protein